ncbi:MAG TPA: LacI family DNA-binding transcriptional regulator [Anaerolineales bacterium]|nr:LacI family DNA-binding transcriptional regulator [Anaerolineales bacterium]
MPPTIRDVAAHAGVSHQTVSRVINGDEKVLPTTRAKVQASIEALGYFPSALARSMARGKSGLLACLAPNLTDYTFAAIIEGAEMAARQMGYFLLASSVPNQDEFKKLIQELVAHRRVEGIMVINPYVDNRFELLPDNFPLVTVAARHKSRAVSSVSLDDVKAARTATEHLLQLGHRDIGLVSGPLDEFSSQERSHGFRMALQSAGIIANEQWIVEGDWTASSGYQALMELHETGILPSAIFAHNDRMAMGVLRAARELGLRVPQQLAVIGFDDMPLASYFDPPLTTIRQDMPEIGRQAAYLLVAATEQPNAPAQHLQIDTELVTRHSTIGSLTQIPAIHQQEVNHIQKPPITFRFSND